jgi:hypothetical protein
MFVVFCVDVTFGPGLSKLQTLTISYTQIKQKFLALRHYRACFLRRKQAAIFLLHFDYLQTIIFGRFRKYFAPHSNHF